MTDKTTAEREAFEAWMNQQDQADPEPERTYELDEDGMNQLTKDCMLVAWQARASLPLPGAQEPVAPHGWLYDWTHSSATGRPDETYTGFTKDEQHARKHDNCTPVYTAPHPALSAQAISAEPAAHVQNPAEIEHVAGDVSKNGAESNMTQQPVPADSVLEDTAFEAVRKKLCALPRYSFALDDDGVVRRVQDRTGNWIEFDEAHALFDPVAVDAARKQGANHD